jgi:hypothetical protein
MHARDVEGLFMMAQVDAEDLCAEMFLSTLRVLFSPDHLRRFRYGKGSTHARLWCRKSIYDSQG